MSGVRTRSAIPASAIKFSIFAAVTVVLIGLLATLIGNISLAPQRQYHALFTDATGVFAGDRVRLSGVQIGRVDEVNLVTRGDKRLARITFSVDEDVPVLRDATLHLRYENIVGQRYLSLDEEAGSSSPMPAGGTFSADQTTPALSLTTLFNGFQPLFQALDPGQVNRFSFELVRALQGEAVSIRSLLADTAALTNTLADKDAVIGRVVENLGAVLTTVGDRDRQLNDLLTQFRDLMAGLAQDKDAISRSLPSLSGLLGDSSDLIAQVRQPLRADIASLGGIANQLRADKDVLAGTLERIPNKFRTLVRTASYGSWFNFYVCGLELELQLGGGAVNFGTPELYANEKDTVCGQGVQQ